MFNIYRYIFFIFLTVSQTVLTFNTKKPDTMLSSQIQYSIPTKTIQIYNLSTRVVGKTTYKY